MRFLKHKYPTLFIYMFIMVFMGLLLAQNESGKNKETPVEKSNVDIWLNTIWEDSDDISVKDREFETEKVTTVAGVRGKEAEMDIMKHLYLRKQSNNPIQKQLELAVQKLETILREYPSDTRNPQWKHYLIQCYIQQGNDSKANSMEKELKRDFPNSKWTAIYTKNQP